MALIVAADQGEGHGEILERVGGQQQGIAPQVKLVNAQRPAEAVQDPTAMVRQVELPDPLVQAVVNEAVGEVQEEVSVHRPEDLLDAHPIVKDAVEHGVADFVVVQGAGFHARGGDAEGRATVAPGPVFAVGDVEIDGLLVGDGTDLTVKDILALTQLLQVGHGLGSGRISRVWCERGDTSSPWPACSGDLDREPYLPARRL